MSGRAISLFLIPCGFLALTGCSDSPMIEPETEQAVLLASQGVGPTASEADGAAVAALRRATARYNRVERALEDGFISTEECVALPDGSAAMGVHFVHLGRLADGTIEAEEPEVLLYEPMRNGRMRLVGVEYVIFRSDWGDPPGPFFLGEEYHHSFGEDAHGLPDHYELHIWTWKHNPWGLLAAFNPTVSCDHFEAPPA